MNDLLPLLGRLLVVLVAIIVGVAVVFAVRRWAQREETVDTFTFQDLRDMKARGEINEREFQAMRTALLLEMGAHVGDEDGPSGGESGRDAPDSAK